MDDNKALYSISVIAELINEHPETLRVWERNGLIQPDRSGYQRRYSNNDIKRLNFIKHLIDDKGFNVASCYHVLNMYPCWYNINCEGGKNESYEDINQYKPCWKKKDTYCIKISDKSEMCCCCKKLEKINKQRGLKNEQ